MVAILRTVIVTRKTWYHYSYRSCFWRWKPEPQLSNLLGWAKAYPFRIFSHGPIDGWWLSCLRLWWLQIEHQITTHKITSYETTYLVACYCWCYGWCWIWCGLWWMWVWCCSFLHIGVLPMRICWTWHKPLYEKKLDFLAVAVADVTWG